MRTADDTLPRTAPVNPNDVDLSKVLSVLKRHWLPLLLIPSLTAGGTYALLNRVPPTYQAGTSIMSGGTSNGNLALNGAIVSATQLPEGAVDSVIHSRALVEQVIGAVQSSSLPPQLKSEIASDLRAELSSGQYRRLQVRTKIDNQQRGVYTLTSTAESPAAARVLANAATQSLLQWDVDRVRIGVTQARRNLQDQLDNLTARLATLPPNSVERDSLVAARGQLLLSLSQATVLEQGAIGSLVRLAEANDPSRPIAPKPLRNAVLAFLLALFATAGSVLLRDSLRRKINAPADLPPGLPILGSVPRLKSRKRSAVLQNDHSGAYEAGGFIRVNVLAKLEGHSHPVIVVTSPGPFNGKSTVTAMMAKALAEGGRRVLLIDLDLHRPTQHEFWPVAGLEWRPLPEAVTTPNAQRSILDAAAHPDQASVLAVAENIDLLPAQAVSRQVVTALNNLNLMQQIRTWAQQYDAVLLDTPPVLALSDALLLGQASDGVVMVASSGETSTQELERAVDAFTATQGRLLGVILNKVPRSSEGYAYYSYRR
ncbi:AAA family ATPase [Deinococcus ficus]|uniref:Uncharacterized protein n=1 Tax=Deinococcus ficus TaxID=317577 RepID=A0A221T217_9DEIO|nr:AAA family ATPase [Deinococcus ficus]ASN82935.1 hypothetical protein DFI_17260 [Deinococcus ficus]